MNIVWLLKKFDQLTPRQLYAFLQLRSQVFVVEQRSIFLDTDDKDQDCYHLLGFLETKLIAYARIVPAGVNYHEASIGRVVTSASIRGQGAGRELMKQSIHALYSLFGKLPIKIGAQLYLKKFYQSLGFEQVGSIYLEDGIEHICMIKK